MGNNIFNQYTTNKDLSMKVDFRREIENLKRRNISILTPMFEAIANSIEAKATDINIEIETTNADLDIETLTSNTLYKKRLYGYSVRDNGEGFTDKNITSFCTLRSDYKKQYGCLGYGRTTWLIVFEKVDIESYVNNKEVIFTFDIDNANDLENITQQDCAQHARSTAIKFYNLTKPYKDNSLFKNLGSDQDIVSYIKESIVAHFLIKLCLMKKDGQECTISIKLNNITDKIDMNTLPSLSERSFTIKDEKQEDTKFSLFYHILNCKRESEIYYCANGRAVCKIKKIPLKHMKDSTFIAMLKSDYLDDYVNDSRTDFNFPKNDLINVIDEDVIMEHLRPVIDQLLIERYPEIQEQNKNATEEAISEAPYLASYIKKDTSIIKDKDELIKNAEKLFKDNKVNIRNKFNKILKSKKLDQELEDIIPELSDIQARELGEYIVFRETLIMGLQKLSDRKEKYESLLHDIFMKRRTDSDDNNHSVYDNNIWLLDDKFMSYVFAVSDKQIKTIKEKMGYKIETSLYNEKRPDMAMFYNSKNNLKDVVVIEFKGLGAPKSEKEKSITELPKNLRIIRNEVSNIQQIWGYIITDFDEEYIDTLKDNEFKLISKNGDFPIYYRYYEQLDASIYVYSVGAILFDAQARNKVFLDILKKID